MRLTSSVPNDGPLKPPASADRDPGHNELEAFVVMYSGVKMPACGA